MLASYQYPYYPGSGMLEVNYREAALLARPLHLAEVEEVDHSARHIAALLALTEELDVNYRRVAGLHTAS